jgi:hypothetical protein
LICYTSKFCGIKKGVEPPCAEESGVTMGIKMQYAVYIRGVAKSPGFKFQGRKLVNIPYFKLQHLAVWEMIEQGLYL